MAPSRRSSPSSSHRRITFAPRVRVQLTVGRWELSPLEHARTWISPEDIENSQAAVLESVRHMRHLVTEEGELAPDCESILLSRNITSRGIEHMRTRHSVAARRHVKLDVVDAVLDEQYRQRCDGFNNPVTVAEASMFISKRCRAKAAVRGGEDAAMARVLHQRDGSCTSSSDDDKSGLGTKQSASRSSTRATTTTSRYSTNNNDFDAVSEEDASVAALVDALGECTAKEDRAEVDTMYTNVSHKRLREKLLQRVSGLAKGA